MSLPGAHLAHLFIYLSSFSPTSLQVLYALQISWKKNIRRNMFLWPGCHRNMVVIDSAHSSKDYITRCTRRAGFCSISRMDSKPKPLAMVHLKRVFSASLIIWAAGQKKNLVLFVVRHRPLLVHLPILTVKSFFFFLLWSNSDSAALWKTEAEKSQFTLFLGINTHLI